MNARDTKPKTNLRIGISGWTYEPWRGVFYPDKLRQADELAYASRQLNSIEINGTFYALMKPGSFASWHDATPADFVFSVKCPRFITHIKRLGDVEKLLANFFASGVLGLGKKLGPFLWQLPPNFKFDAEKLERFFEMLPRTAGEAERVAAGHDDKVKGRALLKAPAGTVIRHALEVRNESFETPAFLPLLRKHGIAIVIADTAGKWPQIEEITADFAYLRLHGADELYVSGYTPKGLDAWAAKIGKWTGAGKGHVRDLFVYFDNDVKVRSPADAVGLSERLGVEAGETRAERWPMEGEDGDVVGAAMPGDVRLAEREKKAREAAERGTARTSWPAIKRAKKSGKETPKRVGTDERRSGGTLKVGAEGKPRSKPARQVTKKKLSR